MNKKEIRKYIYSLSAIEVYKHVLSGKYIKRFPKGFWEKLEVLNNAKEITKWLIEEKLNLSDKELKEQLSIKLFKDNGLYGMIILLFNGSPYNAINNAYPNKFKE